MSDALNENTYETKVREAFYRILQDPQVHSSEKEIFSADGTDAGRRAWLRQIFEQAEGITPEEADDLVREVMEKTALYEELKREAVKAPEAYLKKVQEQTGITSEEMICRQKEAFDLRLSVLEQVQEDGTQKQTVAMVSDPTDLKLAAAAWLYVKTRNHGCRIQPAEAVAYACSETEYFRIAEEAGEEEIDCETAAYLIVMTAALAAGFLFVCFGMPAIVVGAIEQFDTAGFLLIAYPVCLALIYGMIWLLEENELAVFDGPTEKVEGMLEAAVRGFRQIRKHLALDVIPDAAVQLSSLVGGKCVQKVPKKVEVEIVQEG